MVTKEIQQGKMTIEVDVAFLKRDINVLLPNMEALLDVFFKKEGCNGYALYARPKITLKGEFNGS